MDITPPFKTRWQYPGLYELADHWRDWGYRDDQHHCVLVAFFEAWNAGKEDVGNKRYHCLAKILEDHYREAAFPSDGVFVYWLSGERRVPRHSYIHSREQFNERYLAQFGPLFDVAKWLNEYRADAGKAVQSLTEMAGPDGVSPLTKPGEIGRGRNRGDNVTPVDRGNSAAYLVAKLKRDRPDVAARLAAGEFRSARSAAIEAGIVKPQTDLDRLRTAWRRASSESRHTFLREVLQPKGLKALLAELDDADDRIALLEHHLRTKSKDGGPPPLTAGEADRLLAVKTPNTTIRAAMKEARVVAAEHKAKRRR